jgi:hypothetical protein
MQDTDRINAGIAQQLVGRTHATGSFVSCEPRNGKITMTSQCSQCGGPHSGISLTNAAQAVKNPTARLIVCNHCKFIEPTAKALTFEDVIRIPEQARSAQQQRIVVEYENAERSAQQRAAKEAPVIAAREQANRAVKASLFESHERLLVALAHICVASHSKPSATMPSTETPEVRPARRGSDREWITTDMRVAIFVLYAGYKLSRTEPFYSDAGREKTRFVFSGDSNLPAVIQKFRNERLLLVEAQAFHDAGFTIRGAMREMKGQV